MQERLVVPSMFSLNLLWLPGWVIAVFLEEFWKVGHFYRKVRYCAKFYSFEDNGSHHGSLEPNSFWNSFVTHPSSDVWFLNNSFFWGNNQQYAFTHMPIYLNVSVRSYHEPEMLEIYMQLMLLCDYIMQYIYILGYETSKRTGSWKWMRLPMTTWCISISRSCIFIRGKMPIS